MTIPATAIVIAGASGDLAKRKLVPALDILFGQGKLGESPLVVGTGRTAFTDDDFRSRFSVSAAFAQRLAYHRGIAGLKDRLAGAGAFGRVVFFLALPPEVYADTAREIVAEGFGPETSLIIEKPFGYDAASARELNRDLTAVFDESQIFRIDHYLAKEAVQNILVFRFANSIFYPIWNNSYVESIQISALENLTVNDRGAYFDKAGIIRDMVQNHLLQLLCLLTMEAPLTLRSEDICCRKIDVLRALHIDSCNRFQYSGYRSARGIAPMSDTETFAELQLSINNFRWVGVPVFIRTGKAVHRKGTEIGVRFKKIPRLLFNEKGDRPPNQIVFKIQPAEGIILDIQHKIPGTDAEIEGSTMNFCFSKENAIPDAYLRLLYDVLRLDRTLFVSARESEAAWEVIDPVLGRGAVTPYEPGRLPESKLPVNWIDFEAYLNKC